MHKKYLNSSLCYELLKSNLTNFRFSWSYQISDQIWVSKRFRCTKPNKIVCRQCNDLQTIDLSVRLYEDTLDDSDLILKALAAKRYIR